MRIFKLLESREANSFRSCSPEFSFSREKKKKKKKRREKEKRGRRNGNKVSVGREKRRGRGANAAAWDNKLITRRVFYRKIIKQLITFIRDERSRWRANALARVR